MALISKLSSLTSVGKDIFDGCSSLSPDLLRLFYVKPSSPKKYNKNNSKNTINEFKTLKALNHPNVIKALGLSFKDKVQSIELEVFPTNLQEVIQEKKFSKVQLVYSIYQIAEGMKYIHSQNIILLNLRPTNILISENGTIKISDFKNAQKIISENETGKMEDFYSFGNIIYFILSGHEINNSEKETVLKSFSLPAQQLIEKCFYNNTMLQPTFEMILSNLEKNNFNLISLSQQEIEEVSELITQYKKQIAT